MREDISLLIDTYVSNYEKKKNIKSQWKKPIVKFASAKDNRFLNLKQSVNESHLMPEDLLEGSQSIITYFLPFEESIVNSNITGSNSSREWSVAYIETNQLISDLNQYIIEYLEKNGFKGISLPATHNFDEKTLMSQWSHRHIAEIAGLGTFGLNNMLITESGCCGRIGSVVTNLYLEPSEKIEEELCLYKLDGSCGICVNRCQFNALTYSQFDRKRCYEICLTNDKYHLDLDVTDVCGKCCVNLPCSFNKPNKSSSL